MNDDTNRNPSNEPRIDSEEILAGVPRRFEPEDVSLW